MLKTILKEVIIAKTKMQKTIVFLHFYERFIFGKVLNFHRSLKMYFTKYSNIFFIIIKFT